MMRSESTSAFGQPSDTKLTFGAGCAPRRCRAVSKGRVDSITALNSRFPGREMSFEVTSEEPFQMVCFHGQGGFVALPVASLSTEGHQIGGSSVGNIMALDFSLPAESYLP